MQRAGRKVWRRCGGGPTPVGISERNHIKSFGLTLFQTIWYLKTTFHSHQSPSTLILCSSIHRSMIIVSYSYSRFRLSAPHLSSSYPATSTTRSTESLDFMSRIATFTS